MKITFSVLARINVGSRRMERRVNGCRMVGYLSRSLRGCGTVDCFCRFLS